MLYDFPRNICLRGVMVIDRKTDNMNWHENIPRDFHRVNRSCSHRQDCGSIKKKSGHYRSKTVTTAGERSIPQESGHYRRRAVITAGERSLPLENGHYRWRAGVPKSMQMLQYIITRLFHTTFFPLRETTGTSFLLLIKVF